LNDLEKILHFLTKKSLKIPKGQS